MAECAGVGRRLVVASWPRGTWRSSGTRQPPPCWPDRSRALARRFRSPRPFLSALGRQLGHSLFDSWTSWELLLLIVLKCGFVMWTGSYRGFLCDLMILHACGASRGEKHHFLLAVPLSRTPGSKSVSSSDFRAMQFVLESLLEERASCWCLDFPVTWKSVAGAVSCQGSTAEWG